MASKGHVFEYYMDRNEDTEILASRMGEADIAVISNIPLPAAVLSRCPSLQYLSVAFTGLDHIDMDFCREHHITVQNAAGYSTTAVSEPDPDATTRVYALGRTVVTEAPANLAVTIYNTMGQQMLSVPSRQDQALRRLVSQPLTSGVYVVRIGDKPATKVIVK